MYYEISPHAAIMLVVYFVLYVIFIIVGAAYWLKRLFRCPKIVKCQKEQCLFREWCPKAVLSDREWKEIQKGLEKLEERIAAKPQNKDKYPENRAESKRTKKQEQEREKIRKCLENLSAQRNKE